MKIPNAGRAHSPCVFSFETQLGPLSLAYPITAARDWQFRLPALDGSFEEANRALIG